MAQQIVRTMFHTAQSATTGDLVTTIRSHSPDLLPGDLAYLDPNRPNDVQIRPMLDGERPAGSLGPFPAGSMWLVYVSPTTGHHLRSLVTLPAPYRKNIASNVARAIRRVAQVSPAHAHAFEMARKGVDPFAPKGHRRDGSKAR